jgi:hypothetical protein
MQNLEMISGFNEIKSRLLKKYPDLELQDNLRLWFSIELNVLFVHAFHDHSLNMALAIPEPPNIKIFLPRNSHGYNLILNNYDESQGDKTTTFFEIMNSTYRLYGTYKG